jgi:uncharacterized protein YaaN involved in tellurite resistance
MKGKKSDPEFVAEFIKESVELGLISSDDIVSRARKHIDAIDEMIRAVEESKKTRAKLLDVISTFESHKKDKLEEVRLLSFFSLEDQPTCKFICDMVKLKPLSAEEQQLDPDARFAIKQLLEAKILLRVKDSIERGERFDEYMTFVLREDK